MSTRLTNTGQTRINELRGLEQPLIIDRMVLALIPGQDPAEPVNRTQQMPDPANIVYTYTIPAEYKGYVAPDQVVYSMILGSAMGNFSFNWIGLIEKDTDTVMSVTVLPDTPKYKTDLATNTTGNCITRNVLQEYQDAQDLTGITVSAETWQFDYQAELSTQAKKWEDHEKNTSNPHGVTQAQIGYNAADVLAKLKTVHGKDSGLDADLLDGKQGSFYQDAENQTSGTLPLARLLDTFLPVDHTALGTDCNDMRNASIPYHVKDEFNANCPVTYGVLYCFYNYSMVQSGDGGNYITQVLFKHPTNDIYIRTSGGTGSNWSEWDSLALSSQIQPAFPAGTSMLFNQAAAPTGWVKKSNWANNASLIIGNTFGSGGSDSPTSWVTAVGVGAHAAHTHTGPSHTHGSPSHNHAWWDYRGLTTVDRTYGLSGVATTFVSLSNTSGTGCGLTTYAASNKHMTTDAYTDTKAGTTGAGGTGATGSGGPTTHSVSQDTYKPIYQIVIAATKS